MCNEHTKQPEKVGRKTISARFYLQFAARETGNASIDDFFNDSTGVHIAAAAAVVPLNNLRFTCTRYLQPQQSLIPAKIAIKCN